MPIPKEILAVKRPSSSRVKETSKSGIYNVIKRTSIRKNGKIVPLDKGLIGKIINGVYYPIEKKEYEVDCKSYGMFGLNEKTNSHIFSDLLNFYDFEDARKLYVLASLRVISPEIKNEEIKHEYDTNYISEVYTKCALSPNTISSFLEKIGKSSSKMEEFMNKRLEEFSNHTVVVDGMLKDNTSKTNIYSEMSRKSRTKGAQNFNLIYAYDVDSEEPIASSIYPGNMLDYTAFKDFLKTYDMKKGLLILDKGFNDKECKELMQQKNISYLIPIKLDFAVKKLNLKTGFKTSFSYDEDTIRAKKMNVNDKTYYCFKSTFAETSQKQAYMNRVNQKGVYDEDKFLEKEDLFGLILFESSDDLNLKDVYIAYKKRWQIESLFKQFKNILELNEGNVQGNYRIKASEFINFLSSIMLCRIKNYLFKLGLLEDKTISQIFRYLSKVEKRRKSRLKEEWENVGTLKYIQEITKKLKI
ncbi:transposase [Mycoplasma mycoides subsp. capri]|uniref:transposase n=1 Tax=Mycoplasma mycoides TaxID=2102 RepID=UPI002240718C|nr:transposase [Mycoplasma mycoides]QVJ95919.1 transposase [Mycoplasma mycoides subsp. capri]QVJ95921.1 transposase [Mycoplasma mycoides subsp. capri]QVJ96481.1 transposase [Mycoplasma mycoides subsp. capri]QVJ96812.1 transposase [Mycoplasma mycoides subsp. capri]QVJ96814.1 transposase [Mycoplasma mycoides subsp. capri]